MDYSGLWSLFAGPSPEYPISGIREFSLNGQEKRGIPASQITLQ
jgi:hypothetical protein